jgi:hypothetical protein
MSSVQPNDFDTRRPGVELLRASNKADAMGATGALAIILDNRNGAYHTSFFSGGLTYSQAIALLDIQKARLLAEMIAPPPDDRDYPPSS